MSSFFHSLRTILGASTLATALALAPMAATAAADQPAAAADDGGQVKAAEDLATRRDLAEAVVVVSHLDDVLFGCIANQQLGVQDVDQERFTPDLRAAYLKVQPEIRQLIVDTWVDYDADELRAWLQFFASNEGQRVARKMSAVNAHLNQSFGGHLGVLLGEIKKAEQQFKAESKPADRPAQGGF
jgi:hypothetical protein